MSEWNDLSESEKQKLINEFMKDFERAVNASKNWLHKAFEKCPDKVNEFLFIHGRLPQKGEIEV